MALSKNPDVKVLPKVNASDCGRAAGYTPGAERAGIEGDVQLRVFLDEAGRVTKTEVGSGLGHGLDESATEALTKRCRFQPAIGMDGTPVAYVIPYTFTFALRP